MTGRARLAGQTRIQIIWNLVHGHPMTCKDIAHTLILGGERCTHTAVDKTLRDMIHAGTLTRVMVRATRGQKNYLYAAAGKTCPTDGRLNNIRLAHEARKAPGYIRKRKVDSHTDEGDNWGQGRCARKTGTPSDLPAIPSLAELLAR